MKISSPICLKLVAMIMSLERSKKEIVTCNLEANIYHHGEKTTTKSVQ